VRKLAIILITLLPLYLHATTLKKLDFKTNGEFKSSELYTALGIQTPSWYQFWKEKTPLINIKIIPSLHESLEYFYKSEGFYHARVEKIETNSSVIFEIDEGKSIHITSITIESDEDIDNLISYQKGDRFRTLEFTGIKKEIKNRLLEKGYCNYALDTKARIDIEKDSVEIIYNLKKNKPCKFGKITINTPDNVDDIIIASRLHFTEGSTYSSKLIRDSYTTISGLEAFDGVQLSQKRESDVIHLNIDLKKKSKRIRQEIGIGYETDLGPKGIFR